MCSLLKTYLIGCRNEKSNRPSGQGFKSKTSEPTNTNYNSNGRVPQTARMTKSGRRRRKTTHGLSSESWHSHLLGWTCYLGCSWRTNNFGWRTFAGNDGGPLFLVWLTETVELGGLVPYPDEGSDARDHLRPSALGGGRGRGGTWTLHKPQHHGP